MKSIILCADDYGQNSAISQAVVDLIEKKRLSATSCIVTMPEWSKAATDLSPYVDICDVGLHFNLTEGQPLSSELQAAGGFQPVPNLITKAFLRQLSEEALHAELNAQLDHFIAGIGRLPDFLDGHQHVHQLPIIRDVLIKVYEERRLQDVGCYIRAIYDEKAWFRYGQPGYGKNMILQLCGGISFKKLLLRYDLPHNSSFAGVYDFTQSNRYTMFFPHFLSRLEESGILMVHPGSHIDLKQDPISRARLDEYRYLNSNAFLEACTVHQIEIRRFYH